MAAATDNIRLAVKVMNQTAVYWPPEEPGRYGRPTYGTAIEIACRWDDVQKEFISARGDQEVSLAELIVDRDLEVKGVLMLGVLSDVVDLDDPKSNEGAWEIRMIGKTPDKKARKFLREAIV